MMKWLRLPIAIALVALLVSTAAFAQGPPPPGPGGNRAGSSQFSQMREKYKYTFQLMSMVRHVGEIDKDPKYALTQTQAKKVLAVLTPLRSKPKLTQDQAKTALKNLKPIFTVNQLNAMARIKPRRPAGQLGAGRTGGPGGPGGDQARRQRFDPNAMKDFNPFYVKVTKGDKFAAERAKRWNDFFKGLDNKAKGIKAKPAPKPKVPAKKK